MNIGICPASKGSGGVYQYGLTMIQVLQEWKTNTCIDELIIFEDKMNNSSESSPYDNRWNVKPIQPSSLKRVVRDLLLPVVGENRLYKVNQWIRYRERNGVNLPDPDVIRFQPDIRQWFQRLGVELMLYPVPMTLSFETSIPYVMAVHDLQHRLQPEFPEVSANGEWERREYLFRNGIRYSTLVLADSEVGKEDILNFYSEYDVTPDRVKILPFIPASYLESDISESDRQLVKTTYHLPDRYIFYPAQFWPHKNHARIIQALNLIKNEYKVNIPIILCGSFAGELRTHTYNEIIALVNKYGLEKEVHYLGYVPDQHMSAIYAGAVALVMPTFFGPTNIPILEAWAFGCPVITSDIRGVREQAGDAAILVNPSSVEAIADGIYRLWTDEELRFKLSILGRQRLACYSPDEYKRLLVEIIEEAKMRVRSKKKLVSY